MTQEIAYQMGGSRQSNPVLYNDFATFKNHANIAVYALSYICGAHFIKEITWWQWNR